MEKRTYRYGVKRARVTDQITNTLLDLVEREKDFEKKKKHPAIWYRKEVATALHLHETENPSLRSYEEALKPIRAKYREKNPLDRPWDIGSCIRYDIPNELVPVLVYFQSHLEEQGEYPFTVRTARWLAKLYKAISLIIKEYYSNEIALANDARMLMIAETYSRKELISEITNKPLDTSEWDKIYFTLGDLSPYAVIEGYMKTEPAGIKLHDDIMNFLRNNQPPAEEFEPIFGGLSKEELALINDYLLAFHDGTLARLAWKKQHPEDFKWIKEKVEAYIQSKKDGENERSSNIQAEG